VHTAAVRQWATQQGWQQMYCMKQQPASGAAALTNMKLGQTPGELLLKAAIRPNPHGMHDTHWALYWGCVCLPASSTVSPGFS